MRTYGTLNLNPLLIGGGIAGQYIGDEIYNNYYNSEDSLFMPSYIIYHA